MGRIVSNFFMSLDGVVEAPERWHFPYFDDEMGAGMGAALADVRAFLMGRVLYEEWAAYWPGSTDEPFASLINGTQKYVVSSTLTEAGWANTAIVNGDVAARIREIKESTDGTLGMSGSATLSHWLLENDLLDELSLLVHPVVVGSGRRLYQDLPSQGLRLVSQETFGSGVLNLTYAKDGTAG